MVDVVEQLSNGLHPVEVSLRPAKTVDALRECLEREFINITFTDTQGGTELGMPIDQQRSDLSGANLVEGTGRLTIVGELTLDYVNVRCVADIELPSLRGQGRLERMDSEPALQ